MEGCFRFAIWYFSLLYASAGDTLARLISDAGRFQIWYIVRSCRLLVCSYPRNETASFEAAVSVLSVLAAVSIKHDSSSFGHDTTTNVLLRTTYLLRSDSPPLKQRPGDRHGIPLLSRQMSGRGTACNSLCRSSRSWSEGPQQT